METRSAENFGNEGARDFLSMETARLVATITEVLADPERASLDEDGESLLMPCVELLALLCERYGASPPRAVTVRQWHEKYLAVYDREIDDLKPRGDFKAARRQVIDRTFRWLEGLAGSHHGK